MSATLSVAMAPDLAPDAWQITIDCRHGTTSLTLTPPRDPTAYKPHEAACVRLALLKHSSEEGCTCTRKLRCGMVFAEVELMESRDEPPAGSLLFHALDLAGLLDWPATAIAADEMVGPGRDAWEAWGAQASRRQLARAIGVLVARQLREAAT